MQYYKVAMKIVSREVARQQKTQPIHEYRTKDEYPEDKHVLNPRYGMAVQETQQLCDNMEYSHTVETERHMQCWKVTDEYRKGKQVLNRTETKTRT